MLKSYVSYTWTRREAEEIVIPWISFQVIAILLIIGGVELNPGPYISKHVSHPVNQQYKKRPSCIPSLPDMSYEVKLTALLFTRGLNAAETFCLASGMEDAAPFGDLVLKLGSHTVFIQIKYQKDTTRMLQLSELLSEDGDFSLVRSYESYCKLKQHWLQNDDLKFYENTSFIVYTNAVLDTCVECEVGNTNWHSNISSGGKFFRCTRDIFSAKELGAEYEVFLSQLCFFTEQASENKLVNLINEELHTLLGSSTVLSQILLEIKDWWSNSNIYLTDKIQFWENIVQNHIFEISQVKHKEIETLGVSFGEDQHALIQTFLMFAPVLHIVPKENTTILSCLKVHQSLTRESYLLVGGEIVHYRWNEILTLWSRWCDVLVIVEPGNLDVEVLIKIIHKCPEKRLVIVAGTWMAPEYKCITFHDRLTLEQLDWESRAQVLAIEINFQGYNIPFGSFIDGVFESLPDDVIMQLLTGKITFECAPCYSTDLYLHRPLRRENILPHLFEKVVSLEDLPYIIGLVLIYADPGLGKSTLITQLALNTKQSNPAVFIIRANLEDFSAQLESLPEEFELHHVVEFLLDASGIKTNWRPFFRCKLTSMKNVFVLLDGLDEVIPSCVNKVVRMIKILQRSDLQKLCVTSRNRLKDLFWIPKHISLEPFSEEEKTEFLTLVWKKKFPDIEEGFVTSFASELLQLTDKDFSGVPLQLRLLAEVFENDLKHYIDTREFRLSHSFDVLQLYSTYVDKTIENFGLENSDTVKIRFMVSALLALLPSQDLTTLCISESEITEAKKFVNKLEESEEKKSLLRHRMFSKYFAALWFSRNYKNVEDYLRQKFFSPEFIIISTFFDQILAQDFELHMAVLNRDKVLVEALLLEKKLDVNEVDKGGRTALHLAVMNYNYTHDDDDNIKQIVNILLTSGADSSIEDKVFCWRPLRLAERLSAWVAVDLLLENKVDSSDLVLIKQNLSNEEYIENVLREAAKQGCVQVVSILLNSGIPVGRRITVDHDDFPCEVTVLHEAARHGKLKLVQFLVDNKINIEARDSFYERTAVMWAAKVGELQVIEYLVQQGSNINLRSKTINRTGNSALLIAAFSGNLDTVKWLIQHGSDITALEKNGNTVLHCAAISGNRELVTYLLDIGQDIDCLNNDKETPLFVAAHNGELEVIELLCERGARLDSTGEFSPLHTAAVQGKLQVVQHLFSCGASLNPVDFKNRTPLHDVARWGMVEMVQYLVQSGASINPVDKDRRTPLHDGVVWGVLEVVQCLVEHGASLTVLEKWWRTPLQEAARWGVLQVVEYLVQQGASIDVRNKRGRTPLHEAARWGHENVVKYLVQQGANLRTLDKKGHTALDVAVQNERWDVVGFLRIHMM